MHQVAHANDGLATWRDRLGGRSEVESRRIRGHNSFYDGEQGIITTGSVISPSGDRLIEYQAHAGFG